MKNKIVSHYEVLDKLGCGGMGEIYKAKDLKLNRIVALKFLSPAYHFDPLVRKGLLNEAKTAALLDHKNICTIYEVNETDDGQVFLAMAYYEGETLGEKMDKAKIDYKKSIEIIIQISNGLLQAHEKNIVHRDIKPDNIFITNDGLVKILDFGIAKTKNQTQITRCDATPGTVSYMSPEQIKGEEIDNKTDIWSLGVVFYELLTGQKPFKGESDPTIIYSILDEEPPALNYYNNNLPANLQQIVDKLLCKDRNQRYQSLYDQIKDLKLILGQKITLRQKLLYNKSRIKRYSVALLVLILVAAIYWQFNDTLFRDVDSPSKKIPIAIISFENQTSDTSYNYLQNVIPNLLITSLEQSNYFDITTWERLNDLEKQIHNKNFKFLNGEIGFELCKKDNVDLMVSGSYTKAGNTFITDVKVISVDDKKLLTSFTAKGDGKESLLGEQIDVIAKEISRNLGLLKIGDVPKLKPISDVTTNSLEAYHYYLRGKEEFNELNWENSKNLLLKTIEIDSTFALAYAYLGIDYSYLHNTKEMIKVMEKAMNLSYRANEKEKGIIEAQYAILVESNLMKFINIYENLERLYPQEKWFHICLGYGYAKIGRRQEAMEQWEKILSLDPHQSNTLNQLGYAYVELGDYEKAFYYFDKLIEACPNKPNPLDSMGDLFLLTGNIEKSFYYYSKAYELSREFGTQIKIAYLFALQQNFAEAIWWIDRRIKSDLSNGDKSIAYFWKGFYQYILADSINAYKNFAHAEMSAKNVDSKNSLSNIYYLLAWLELENNSFNSSKKIFNKWIGLQESIRKELTPVIKLENLLYNSWFALNSSSPYESEKELAKMKELISQLSGYDSLRLNNLINIYNASALFSKNLFKKATEIQREIYQPEISIDFRFIKYNLPTHIDIAARCYEILGDIDKAIKEYENISYYNPQKKEIRIINPDYHYRLGMLYEKKGLKEKAIKEYQFYLKIFKDFNVENPSLIDTKKEAAKFGKIKYGFNMNTADYNNNLVELISLLNNVTDFDEILRIALDKISELVDAEIISILMINPQTRETIKTLINEEKFIVTGKYHFINSAISGWVIKNKQSFLSNNLKTDGRFKRDLFIKSPFENCICTPIISSGKIIGTVIVLSPSRSNVFNENALVKLENICSVISPFIYKTQKIQEYFFSPILSEESLVNKYKSFGLIGHSPKFVELLKAIESAAKCDVRVLLEGETGTGKELIARAIHKLSRRSGGKIVTLDCGAFPPNLIESELFGHVRGSFTGAITDRKGLLEDAKGGTLFIDEISLLPLELQSRFLRFIQEGEFRPIGDNEVRTVNVRIIAASSSSLVNQVKKGNFREELYYRLNVYPIEVPKLNNRTEDIPILSNLFIQRFSSEQNKKAETVDDEVMYLLLNRKWNGNIRELENFCERLVTLAPAEKNLITYDQLPKDFQKELKKIKAGLADVKLLKPLDKALEEYEEQMIRIALTQNDWNQSKAAEAISVKEQTLRHKMKKLSIIPPK